MSPSEVLPPTSPPAGAGTAPSAPDGGPLSAFDGLLRGVYSLRANWALVPLYALQQVLMLVLLAASAVVLVLPLGLEAFSIESLGSLAAEDVEALLLELLARPATLLAPLLVGVLAASVVGFVGGLVFCWFQGGIMAVLLAADRQAPPGAPRDWRAFRAFDGPAFVDGGRRLTWRYFGLVNLYLVVVLLVLLVATLLIPLVIGAGDRWGSPAALGLGCAGAVPLLGLLVLCALWYLVAQSELPREGSGVRQASRFALELLRRRPGAILLLTVLMLSASLLFTAGVSTGFAPAGALALPLLGDGALGLYCLGQVVLWAGQIAVSGILSIAYWGSLVALVRSESPRPAAGGDPGGSA